MNILLPESFIAFVDQQVGTRGYGTRSEYVRELIRRDQDMQRLRELLLEGAESPQSPVADASYFEELCETVRRRAAS